MVATTWTTTSKVGPRESFRDPLVEKCIPSFPLFDAMSLLLPRCVLSRWCVRARDFSTIQHAAGNAFAENGQARTLIPIASILIVPSACVYQTKKEGLRAISKRHVATVQPAKVRSFVPPVNRTRTRRDIPSRAPLRLSPLPQLSWPCIRCSITACALCSLLSWNFTFPRGGFLRDGRPMQK